MFIREINEEDLEAIKRIEQDVSGSWKLKDFQYEYYENPFSHIYVLEEEDIVGYCVLWIAYENAEISNVAVDSHYQNKGYGSFLMQYMLNKAKECTNISLEVKTSNDSAIHLYKKYGFEIKAIRKNYYEGNQDAYLMVLEMEG
jgi:ribosomal-protein-alanine N-acetyltransferase